MMITRNPTLRIRCHPTPRPTPNRRRTKTEVGQHADGVQVLHQFQGEGADEDARGQVAQHGRHTDETEDDQGNPRDSHDDGQVADKPVLSAANCKNWSEA